LLQISTDIYKDEQGGLKMKRKCFILLVIVAFVTFLYAPIVLAAPILGDDLASFAVLAATGVTSGGTGSTIGGNLGSSPTGSLTGVYNFTSGSLQADTLLAQKAQVQLDAAILAVNAFVPNATIANGNLDEFQLSQTGSVIAPGTYAVAAATTNLTGNLVLDGGGSNTAVWVFQFSSSLITGTSSNVTVQNVGDGAGVGLYWTVGTAATLNGPTFAGNVLANQLISSDGDLTIACGRLLSAEAQVTLIEDNISIGTCLSGGFDQRGSNGGGVPVPEPATMLLLGSGLIGLAGFARRKFKK